jgi:hypothetical protein
MPQPFVLAQAEAPPVPLEAQETRVQELVRELRTPPDPPADRFNTNVIDAFVPIFLFLAVGIVIIARFYFAHRARQEAHTTVRAALDRGVPLTTDLLERLGDTPPPAGADLRRGVIAIGLGLGLAAFGAVVGADEGTERPMLAIGLVPILLGIAYLLLWRLGNGKR